MLSMEAVETEEELWKLEQGWRELVDHVPGASYFQSWEFTSNRWKHFREGRQLWVLVARDGGGKLVGIAPLAIGKGRIGPFRVRRLEFICRVEIPFRFERYYLDGEDLDFLIHPAWADEVAAMFAARIDENQARWDVVDLAWLSSGSPINQHIEQVHKTFLVHRDAPRARAKLPESWETYDSTVLDRGLSKQNRYKHRRLNRDFANAIEFRLITDREEVIAAVDNLEELKSIQFQLKGTATSDDDPHSRHHHQFARDFALDAFDRGWLRFYQLRVHDEIIAANFGVAFNGTYYLLNKGFNPSWKKHSPGYLLQAHEIRLAIEEGLTEYDLGQGLISDKLLWTQDEVDDVRLVYGTSARGLAYVAVEAGWSTARTRVPQFIRWLLPQSAYDRVKRAINRRARSLAAGKVIDGATIAS